MNNKRENIENKDIKELTYQEIQAYLGFHKIRIRPFSQADLKLTYQRLNIDGLPYKLEEYYRNIGNTMCSIQLIECEDDPCTKHELLMLDELKVQDIQNQRYLIFAKSADNKEALFMNVSDINKDNPVIYTTNQQVSTLDNYLYHLLYALVKDESVLKAMRFYTLIEEKKEEKRSEALSYRNHLVNKKVENISIGEFKSFLSLSGITYEGYNQDSLEECLRMLSIDTLPELVITYYLDIGVSSIEKAVPTKMLKIKDIARLEYENDSYLKIIYDENNQNFLCINVNDCLKANPELYRFVSEDETLIKSGQRFGDYLTYLFTVILTSDEWINYLSNL